MRHRLSNQECRRLLTLLLSVRHATDRGWVRVYLGKGHPMADKSGWCWRHRLVASVSLGRKLNTDEHVHHLNRKRGDDRPENFEVIQAEYHGALHGWGLVVARFRSGRLRDLDVPIGPFRMERERAILRAGRISA